jgi:hypothetical protein
MPSLDYKSKPADIFLIAGGPESKNHSAVLAGALILIMEQIGQARL